MKGISVKLSQKTEYPWKGNLKINVNPEKSSLFAIKLRLPDWCNKYTLKVNGKTVETIESLHYLVLNRTWKDGDVIEFNMNMPVKVVAADQRVKDDFGKRAIQRGPLVYCMEECDNKGKYDSAKLSAKTKYTANYEKDLLNGVMSITAVEGNHSYKFIPYYSWDNREAGKMKVWINYAKQQQKWGK